MAKRLAAKVGEYQKDGQTKGEYARLGVIMQNDNGEYLLLDPSVSIAGVLAKQNALAAQKGGQQRDMVMVSIFDDSQQGQQQQGGGQQGGFNQGGQQQGGGFNQGGGQQGGQGQGW
jgi:uncharacterized membrane protein YgcG